MASITRDIFGRLVLTCPYDARVVGEIKTIPWSDKAFDGDTKKWTFSPNVDLRKIADWLRINAPSVISPVSIHREMTVEYIGACKERPDGTTSAFGWCGSGWNVVLSENLLRHWFKDGVAVPGKPTQAQTFYGVLLIAQNADLDAIKKAYKRIARVTHPDVNKESDAKEQFLRIQKAYNVLSDPQLRKRYDLGLQLAPPASEPKREGRLNTYRAPLRSGLITGKITVRARLEFVDISSWEDIKDDRGRVLVTSWERGADFFTSRWLDPSFFSI